MNNPVKRIASAVLGIAVVFAFVLTPAASHAQTVDEQIASLLAQIAELNRIIANLQGSSGSGSGSGSGPASCNFTRNLDIGDSGAEVMDVQKYLNASGFPLASGTSAGAPGYETDFFGSRSAAAVTAWQNANAAIVLNPLGLTNGTGFWGPSSRAHANNTCTTSDGGGVVTPPPAGSAFISAGVQPAASLAPESAARLAFTTFNITGPFTLEKVDVKLGGLADSASFSGVILLKGDVSGMQLGNDKAFNSNDQASIGETYTIPAGVTQQFTVAANMAASLDARAGEVANISVIGVQGSSSVNGSLPITGASHTINATLALGSATATVSSQTNTSTTEEIGTSNYNFSGIRVQAGSAEDIRVHSIRWNNTGSASSGDLNNVVAVVDGVTYPASVSSDGDYWTTSFGSGIEIKKGLQKDFVLRGDIIDGSNRTAIFDIEEATDVHVTGETFGYGITPSASSTGSASATTQAFTTGTPWYDAITVTIQAGSASSISNYSAGAPASNITIADPNAVLGGYSVTVVGEPLEVGTSVFNISAASTSESITNVTIFDSNGNSVAGPQDVATGGSITFSDTITYPTGTSHYVLKGNLSASTGGWSTGNTVIATTTPSSDWSTIRGSVTGDTISLSGLGLTTMSTMTVKPVALTVSRSSLPAAQTIIAGANQVEFARYIFDATNSGEDVRVSNMPLYYDTSGTRTDLTNCQLYDGSTSVTSGSNVLNPSTGDTASSTNITFDGGGLVVGKNTSKTLSLKCDIISGVTSTYWWGLDAGQQSSYTGAIGVESGQTATETLVEANGNIMTAAANGSYTVSADTSNSSLYKAVEAGTTDVTLGIFKFEAGSTEDVILKQVALELGNVASNSPADLANEQVTLWNGTTQIGIAQFGSGSSADNATSTLSTHVTLPRSGDPVAITVKGSLTAQDSVNGTPGAFLSVTYDGDNNGINGNYGSGGDSNVTISGGTSSDVTTNGARIFRTVPTVEVVSKATNAGGPTLAAGTNLYQVKITAGGRDVTLRSLTFDVTTSGVGVVSGFKLYGPSGAVNTTAAATSTDSTLPNERLRVQFDDTNSDRVIDANTSKTYSLRAESLTGLTTGSDSITIALVQDEGYPSLSSLMGTVPGIEATASTTDRFIWSPNSTTSSAATAAKNNNLDWTNGYGVPGFSSPSDEILNSQTFSDE